VDGVLQIMVDAYGFEDGSPYSGGGACASNHCRQP
jgi:hypothetical protein